MAQKKVPHPSRAVSGESVPNIGIDHRIKGELLLMQPVHQGKGVGHMNVVVHSPMNEQHLSNAVLGHVRQARASVVTGLISDNSPMALGVDGVVVPPIATGAQTRRNGKHQGA